MYGSYNSYILCHIFRSGFTLMSGEIVVVTSHKVTAYAAKTGNENWSVDVPWQQYVYVYLV